MTQQKLSNKERQQMNLDYARDGTIPEGFRLVMMKGTRVSFRRIKQTPTIDDKINTLKAKITALEFEKTRMANKSSSDSA